MGDMPTTLPVELLYTFFGPINLCFLQPLSVHRLQLHISRQSVQKRLPISR